MNKRIEEIYQQVMDEVCPNPLYRFAELVRQDEREACAKLCDEINKTFGIGFEAVDRCAAAIRQRG